MRANRRDKSLLYALLLLLPQYAQGLEVAPDSGCSDLCVDTPGVHTDESDPFSSSTQSSDLVCKDSHLSGTNTTALGRKWVQCVGCEASSGTASPGLGNDTETDVFWFLFHLRFNFAWCVLGYPDNTDAPDAADTCKQACNPISQPITGDMFDVEEVSGFEYCSNNDGAFKNHASSCMKCLQKVEGASILANYIKALQVACEQQPAIGEALNLGFEVFAVDSSSSGDDSNNVNSSSSGDDDSNKANSSSSGDDDSNKVKIGVGVGVGVGGAIVLVAAALFFLRRRRRRRDIGDMSDATTMRDHDSGFADKGQMYQSPENKPNMPELGSEEGRGERYELDVR